MVECIRPQLLFLELDPFRSQSLEEDYNVMAVAFQAAKSIGNIEFDLGDLDECSDVEACKLKMTEYLCGIYENTAREELEEAAKDMVHIDIRNLLYQHAQKYSSVLALVGRNHMFGMRHYWHMMTITVDLLFGWIQRYVSGTDIQISSKSLTKFRDITYRFFGSTMDLGTGGITTQNSGYAGYMNSDSLQLFPFESCFAYTVFGLI
ncbi:hypothetical protein A2U01_0003120 [Trifolium medium]|uniref:Uncharacterized protein n=1 Tax=Trifolium medium TaxID=97028 RepID=A0A392M4I8_9FABA|nr:hypothetical protein [Trifolium medium]